MGLHSGCSLCSRHAEKLCFSFQPGVAGSLCFHGRAPYRERAPLGELVPTFGRDFCVWGARGSWQGSQNSETPDAASCTGPDPGTGTQTGAAQASLIIYERCNIAKVTIHLVNLTAILYKEALIFLHYNLKES
jgi:hypothetical protein